MEIFLYFVHALKFSGLILAAGLLPWIAAAGIMQVISNSLRQSFVRVCGLKGYIFLTAPGVMIHELSHAFFCLVFRHKIKEMKLFSPQKNGTLGFVNHQYDPGSLWQRVGNFFIGTGPVWGGLAVLALISKLLLPDSFFSSSGGFCGAITAFFTGFLSLSFWISWRSWIWLYMAFSTASHITLSKSDCCGALDGLKVIVIAVCSVCLLLGWCGNWETGVCRILWDGFLYLFPLLLLQISISAIFAFFLRILTQKK